MHGSASATGSRCDATLRPAAAASATAASFEGARRADLDVQLRQVGGGAHAHGARSTGMRATQLGRRAQRGERGAQHATCSCSLGNAAGKPEHAGRTGGARRARVARAAYVVASAAQCSIRLSPPPDRVSSFLSPCAPLATGRGWSVPAGVGGVGRASLNTLQAAFSVLHMSAAPLATWTLPPVRDSSGVPSPFQWQARFQLSLFPPPPPPPRAALQALLGNPGVSLAALILLFLVAVLMLCESQRATPAEREALLRQKEEQPPEPSYGATAADEPPQQSSPAAEDSVRDAPAARPASSPTPSALRRSRYEPLPVEVSEEAAVSDDSDVEIEMLERGGGGNRDGGWIGPPRVKPPPPPTPPPRSLVWRMAGGVAGGVAGGLGYAVGLVGGRRVPPQREPPPRTVRWAN